MLTPAACAWLMIEATLPPLDLLTYQIHMPCPSKAVPLTAPTATATGGGDGNHGGVQRVLVE